MIYTVKKFILNYANMMTIINTREKAVALCQNFKFFLVDIRLKTLETELKRIQ